MKIFKLRKNVRLQNRLEDDFLSSLYFVRRNRINSKLNKKLSRRCKRVAKNITVIDKVSELTKFNKIRKYY